MSKTRVRLGQFGGYTDIVTSSEEEKKMVDLNTEKLPADFEARCQLIAETIQRWVKDKEGLALIQAVYNEAIDDAANFLRDLAPHNPGAAPVLYGAELAVREWMPLRLPEGT